MADKNFRKGVLTGAAGAVLVFIGLYIGRNLASGLNGTVLSNPAYVQKLGYLEDLIDENYLGEKKEEDLAEGLYTGLIYGLGDPYSVYYTAEAYEEENSSTEGVYEGIGILMQKNTEGGVIVVECYEGGPGEKAGLLEGDIISAIDGTDITDMETSEVSEMIKNSEKGEAVLTVHRENVEEPLEITVEIGDVELPSVFHEMLDGETGYIRITEFKGVTYEQYKNAFSDLSDQGMEKLVIDLRDNPGGLLSSVCDILNEILPEGLIVYTEDKYGNRTEETSDGENVLDLPLAVLVNENSASASEIFAGAVQDYEIGTIVGTNTYGKGVVQSIYRLNDGSAVKLTVANYYTPNGNNINEVGIQPDVEVAVAPELLNKDEISHEEDNQLQAALKALEELGE
ncbi:MAG TPA: S41 family peptidase [Candidatus Blautia faecavium]|mgnify:FL=1|uniref:S41 family peptidase n=1 Tax=Candidatus Blautia faecavium TaxID=2838487 RepID=A0A9D2LRK7_9FIRM|nr:S41 family peptidase [Candidatus Blautia faecavium]